MLPSRTHETRRVSTQLLRAVKEVCSSSTDSGTGEFSENGAERCKYELQELHMSGRSDEDLMHVESSGRLLRNGVGTRQAQCP